MRTLILTGYRDHSPILGNWYQVTYYARMAITEDQHLILKLYKARAGEKKARLIAEITRDGIRGIENGHQPTIRNLLKNHHG